MRILGIDPGIGRCGWSVVDYAGSKLKAIDYGCIETDSKLEVEKRLEEIYLFLAKVIKKHKPDALSIEELFFGSNAKTAFAVGQARGVVLLLASQNNLELGIYTPLQIKMAITGYGRADKNQIGQMVKLLYGLKVIPKLDDTADALAIAATYAFSAKTAKFSK